MPVEIQYLSDIHLEAHDRKNEGYIIPSTFIIPSAPYLALCGDIGNPYLNAYETFLSWCSKSWNLVFLIAGNHEYYNYRSPYKSDMPTRNQKIRDIVSKFPNVIFLDCSTHYLEEQNLRILGCTLWSDTSVGDPMVIMKYMNDTRSIYVEGTEPFLPERMTALHNQHKEWLSKEIKEAATRKEDVLVLTHYLPSYQLISEKYEDSPVNMCFASDCEDLLIPPVKAWICGHSHTCLSHEIKGIHCTMNPYGYPGERVEGRSAKKVLTIS